MAVNIGRWAANWTNGSAEGLALLRIFTSLFILFFLIPGYGPDHFEWLASLPNSVFNPPPGPMQLFSGFPPAGFFVTTHALLVLSLLGMMTGFKTRLSSLASAVLILVLQGWIYSVGKTNHEILIAVVPSVMAFSNWGSVWSIDAMRDQQHRRTADFRALPFLAVILGFMMVTAGFPKILGGWLDFDTQATYGHLLNQYFVKDRSALLAGFFVNLSEPFFWEMLDWATIIFEIGFLAAVYKSRWFRLFVSLAVLFHLSTLMSLNIAFVPNFAAYAVFLNWEKIANFMKSRFHTGGVKTPILFAVLLTVIFIPVKWISIAGCFFQNSELYFYELFVPVSACLLILIHVIIHISSSGRMMNSKNQKT